MTRACHVTDGRTTMHPGASGQQGKTYVGGGVDKRGRRAESDREMDIAAPAKKPRHLDHSVVVRGSNEGEREFKKQFYRSIGDYGVDALLAWENEDNGYPSLLHAAVDYRNLGASGPDPWIVTQLIDMGADVNRFPTGTSRFALFKYYNPMETCACALGTALGKDPHFTKDFRPGYVVNFFNVIDIIRKAGGKRAFSIECLRNNYRAATQDRFNLDEKGVDTTNTMNRFVEDPMFLEAFGLSSPPPT